MASPTALFSLLFKIYCPSVFIKSLFNQPHNKHHFTMNKRRSSCPEDPTQAKKPHVEPRLYPFVLVTSGKKERKSEGWPDLCDPYTDINGEDPWDYKKLKPQEYAFFFPKGILKAHNGF